MRVPRELARSCPSGSAMEYRSTGASGTGRIQPQRATAATTAATTQPPSVRRLARGDTMRAPASEVVAFEAYGKDADE